MSIETLTIAQRQVFDKLIEGQSYKEIACSLKRTLPSVSRSAKTILRKFDCNSRTKLIVKHFKGEL